MLWQDWSGIINKAMKQKLHCIGFELCISQITHLQGRRTYLWSLRLRGQTSSLLVVKNPFWFGAIPIARNRFSAFGGESITKLQLQKSIQLISCNLLQIGQVNCIIVWQDFLGVYQSYGHAFVFNINILHLKIIFI